ncbi:RNA exonuclease 5 [Euwallacea fornicatus]|uniref:RNA exonuclease 5 n=1 Tax=Euwallacea fornicatus TaxID=995702 RepID=UPI00338EB58B
MKGPVENNSKKKQRIENKKKKIAALLDIVKLNESDRQKNKSTKSVYSEDVLPDNFIKNRSEDNGQSPNKKLKTDICTEPQVGPCGKPILQGGDFLELKRMLREKTTKIRQAPKFKLREMGKNATLEVPLDTRCPLFLSDVQHLLMYSQIGVHSPYSPSRWCNLEKYTNLSSVLLLILENVSLYHYEMFEHHFPFTKSNFDHKIEIISPFAYNNDFVKELSMVPVSATQMRKLVNEYGTLEDAAKHCSEVFDTVNHFFPINEVEEADNNLNDGSLPQTDKYSRTQLLLSGWQMVEENFPLPIKGLVERKYVDYVLTKDSYKNVTSHSPLIALDCEMCKTEAGDLELTRVSMVNEKHEVIYDTLVKPENKIIDYLTRFSGINSKMMRNVTTRLKDVQDELKKLLPDDVILVGQSLANDMHALKMMHPYIIDTSVIFNISGDRSRKTKLQTLAREFLEEKIQMSSHGHCSSEDSLACMKLVQLKLKKNAFYGDAVLSSIYSEQRAYPDIGSVHYAISMLKQCIKVGNTVNIVGVDEITDKYKFYIDKNLTEDNQKNINWVKTQSNKDVIKQLCRSMNNHKLNIGHVRIAQDQLADESTEREKTLKILDKWIRQLHSGVQQPALIAVVMSGRKEGGNGACFINLKRDFIS